MKKNNKLRKKNKKNKKNKENKEMFTIVSKPNKICLLGLIPYAYISVYFNSISALTVLINGILFHSKYIDYKLMYYIDTITNIFLISYYIIVSNYDYIIVSFMIFGSTMFIYFNFLNNSLSSENNYFLNNLIHVFFVQLSGFLSFLRYYIVYT
tara:strand:- start:5349 stop:5807 length:459 start_codon:yes stop_codon:yes gene_type:complete